MLMDAEFSSCRTWRYTLTRIWDNKKPTVAAIGLNPSTADEIQDDPTVRRLIGFAQREDFGGLIVLNAFALRSTNPKALYTSFDPVGPNNTRKILEVAQAVKQVWVAWGNHGKLRDRGNLILSCMTILELDNVYCFGYTKSGEPKHPLYLAADTPLERIL